MRILLCVAVIALIFLNGATDASNAIAAAVSSGALSMRRAAALAAAGNLAGGALSGLWFSGVGDAVAEAADYGAYGPEGTLACLLAAVLFTAAAWLLRMPTSESHALLAASAGVTAALGGGGMFFALLPAVLWMTVCTAGGFCFGMLLPRLLPRSLPRDFLRWGRIAAAFLGAFFHGAQDLPKFLALLTLAGAANGTGGPALWIAAGVMGIGTLLGGRRMTEAVGADLADLTPHGALASDLAAACALCLFSLVGMPASTTHAKTAAVAGAAFGAPCCRLRSRQMARFVLAWIAAFPLCAVLGYFCARGILRFLPSFF